ncbi:MAG: HAMP domain-containing histidine kinase [Verrucomicrobiota bacterium]|nr:HAMP domain-containing histidine kinase [Verrucomicrobiota bacterium]
MPETTSPAGMVLDALGYALFIRTGDGSLHAVGVAPEWLRQLWPALAAKGELPISDTSPFFENFLIDAEECWRAGGDERAQSGPWIEQKPDGEQAELEAMALTANGQAILLISRLGAEFAAKKEVLQKARETVIAHQRLNSETQKKEILLHCVAEEMTAALANIVTSLRLIETETNPARSKVLLGLAMRGTEEQQRLINRVLDVFAEEIGSFWGHANADGEGADWDSIVRKAIADAEAAYAERSVRLVERTPTAAGLKIAADEAQVGRVISNLLENALERTPAKGEVLVSSEADAESVLFAVTDAGPVVSADECARLFSNSQFPTGGSSAAMLRLHFCRVTVESYGGEVGCEPDETGGTRFWFRLPESVAT